MPRVNLSKEAARAVAIQQQSRGIFEVPTYGEWSRGDVCGITGEAGVFTFLCARTDEEGNILHVTVYGGPNKQEMWRSFAPDRLTKKMAKKSRRKKSDDTQERLFHT